MHSREPIQYDDQTGVLCEKHCKDAGFTRPVPCEKERGF